MTTLALLSLTSSLAGWLMWLRERSRRITAEKRATNAQHELRTVAKRTIDEWERVRRQLRPLPVPHFTLPADLNVKECATVRALRTFAPAPEECE